jgi:hypothetical protein
MVFLNSPYQVTPENVLNKEYQKRNSTGGWVGLGFSKYKGGSVDFVLPAPRQGASKKKPKNKDQKTKKQLRQKNNDRLFLFFLPGGLLYKQGPPTYLFFGGLILPMIYARRLRAWHPTWTLSASCGVFLCELVPSDAPFIYGISATPFLGPFSFFFFSFPIAIFCIPSQK